MKWKQEYDSLRDYINRHSEIVDQSDRKYLFLRALRDEFYRSFDQMRLEFCGRPLFFHVGRLQFPLRKLSEKIEGRSHGASRTGRHRDADGLLLSSFVHTPRDRLMRILL